MLRIAIPLRQLSLVFAIWVFSGCSNSIVPLRTMWQLNDTISSSPKSVVTVLAFDIDDSITAMGTGFFIDRQGTLVTNYHVLEGAYSAKVKTAEGDTFPIGTVIAHDQLVDLIKVRVEIPNNRFTPIALAVDEPNVADRVVVIGSPMGLDQTISEGIISAVRVHPTNGNIYQLTGPISQGSSGSPVLNNRGKVIGVITFQSAKGQNLNFAVSVKALQMLLHESTEMTLAELAIKISNDPNLAASLCKQGAQLSIRGKYEAALDYFQQATETHPEDPDTWHGLGSCYIGLDKPEKAIAAFNKSIAADPDNATAHFILAMYFKVLEEYTNEITSLLRVIDLDPDNVQARFELAYAYGELNQTDEQIASFKEILEIRPGHVPTLHRMGNTIGRTGRYDEALDLLLQASALEPDNAEIHFDIGVTYHHKKLPDKELLAYTKAIRANPWMAPAHHNLGQLFLSQGNLKLALHQYEVLKSLEASLADRLFKSIYPETIEEVIEPEHGEP